MFVACFTDRSGTVGVLYTLSSPEHLHNVKIILSEKFNLKMKGTKEN